MFKVPERYRMLKGAYGSNSSYGNNGAFIINRGRTTIFCIASDGLGWNHVSVHCESEGKERIPTWAEMCFVKDLFWGKEDWVSQFHPAESEYVDMHKFTLHLWEPIGETILKPPSLLVGLKNR